MNSRDIPRIELCCRIRTIDCKPVFGSYEVILIYWKHRIRLNTPINFHVCSKVIISIAARTTFYNSHRLISFFDFALSEFCSLQQLHRMMHFCIISQLAGCRCNNLSAFLKPLASFVDSTLCTYKQLLSVCDLLNQICHAFHRSYFCLNECTESQHQQSHDEQDDRLFIFILLLSAVMK